MAEANSQTSFQPTHVSPPGETILDVLRGRGVRPSVFAEQLGVTENWANELIAGRIRIDGVLAERLSTILGGSARFWAYRDAQFQENLNRLGAIKIGLPADKWARLFPIEDMAKLGWISGKQLAIDPVKTCLEFFGASSMDAWEERYGNGVAAAFRTSASLKGTPGSTLAWLRKCEIEASRIDCAAWDRSLFVKTLSEIRALTASKIPSDFIPELKRLSAKCGVAVVIVRAPSGCRASGATRFISAEKAVLALSFRHLSDDHFWFTFFHEAGHLVLHEQSRIFLDGPNEDFSEEERQANTFSENILIPEEFRQEFVSLKTELRDIVRFSRKAGIAPGIVVGQLQHHGRVGRNHFNGLKTRFEWA